VSSDSDARGDGVSGAAGGGGFASAPRDPSPDRGWREAESAYLIDECLDDECPVTTGPRRARLFGIAGRGSRVSFPAAVAPVLKRWQEARSPPELNNHGFHDMESLGAVYSRAASLLFRDWNACGKVSGGTHARDHIGKLTGALCRAAVGLSRFSTRIRALPLQGNGARTVGARVASTLRQARYLRRRGPRC